MSERICFQSQCNGNPHPCQRDCKPGEPCEEFCEETKRWLASRPVHEDDDE